jgi:hypothetical protein
VMSLPIFFFGAVSGCAMPVFTAIVPSADPIAFAAFCRISSPAASFGWSFSGSAFFRVAIATKDTTLPVILHARFESCRQST